MTRPCIRNAGRADQIDRFLPFDQQGFINAEGFECSTWNSKKTIKLHGVSHGVKGL